MSADPQRPGLFAVAVALALALACGCGDSSPPAEPTPAVTEVAPLARHDAALVRIADEREALAARYQEASTEAEQAKIRAQARRLLEDTIIDEVFPAWLGMPWGMGSDSTATRPHEPNMKVGCSYFVTSVLLSVGVQLENRFTFAQAPAIHIQRSLAPDQDALHRYFSIPADRLHERIAALGDGLYIIGLDTHVGFVVVRDSEVRMVHASYTEDRVVTDELLVESTAIANSRPKGYFVTPLFQDGRLVDLWLRGQAVPFQRLGP
jgi:hypothetical protein